MAQEQTFTKIRERQGTEVREPKRYKVFIHNDEVTTMEFVVKVLEIVFYKPEEEARRIMLTTHTQGKALVGLYTYDMAKTKTKRAMDMARAEHFPLKLTYTQE